jgi:predicted neutral ceramidase superfamily lipid hydrolase
MKYGKTFEWNNIKYGLQKEIRQGVDAVKKSATVVTTKTADMTREGTRQIAELGKKSKESLKKVFKKVA